MTSSREFNPFYIAADDSDIQLMLQELGLSSLEQLYSHIQEEMLLEKMDLPLALTREQIKTRMSEISKKNALKTNFIGNGLFDYQVPDIVSKVCAIRGLTTAYTPYQPERSQGTLQSLWIYQSALATITGFEAVNASFYERSTCLFEAISASRRLKRGTKKALVADNIYQRDKDVLTTYARHTELELDFLPYSSDSGTLVLEQLEVALSSNEYASFSFAQINAAGLIEDFDAITEICHEHGVLVIGIIDPMALADKGLKEPASWGLKGADMLVAEGQHLTLAPNFGGPGLGIFAVRYNSDNKTHIRATAGRYIGEAEDADGKPCKSIVLSTREQHIRREKATSNICSNQSFLATACGAALLNRGAKGLDESFTKAHELAKKLASELIKFEGVNLAYPGAFFNEFCLRIPSQLAQVVQAAKEQGIHLGVTQGADTLKLALTDKHSEKDIEILSKLFGRFFKKSEHSQTVQDIPSHQKRSTPLELPAFSSAQLEEYYQKLGNLNLSPDDGIYPLGSCTMKYNPEINDWAASLPGFTNTHPEAPIDDVQGNLEVLFEIQNWFKKITGLPAVTTQPVAGAQGELVGIKMFQAYHESKGELAQRNVILIPRSAHGTNPATAAMAGYETKTLNGEKIGIISIEANESGQMDYEATSKTIAEYGNRVAGIMITNPNTAGIFEVNFERIAKRVHEVGGLVYMDGANMNAIAGWVDLKKLGVDAVHNNLHKTWSIPHGGGGPGDAIVAVSEKLKDFLPGVQVKLEDGKYVLEQPSQSIGSVHRHFGNFAHNVRTLTYLYALGDEGIKKMSAVSVLSARYLYKRLRKVYPTLPPKAQDVPRMHEFILTLSEDIFQKVQAQGIPKSSVISQVGKLFLDFGFHAPTVAFPEAYGLMLEPTESFSKPELDKFCDIVETIYKMIDEYPQVLKTTPHFTPIRKVNEVLANKNLVLSEKLTELPKLYEDKVAAAKLREMSPSEIISLILEEHKKLS